MMYENLYEPEDAHHLIECSKSDDMMVSVYGISGFSILLSNNISKFLFNNQGLHDGNLLPLALYSGILPRIMDLMEKYPDSLVKVLFL